jgi:hypothetical protein
MRRVVTLLEPYLSASMSMARCFSLLSLQCVCVYVRERGERERARARERERERERRERERDEGERAERPIEGGAGLEAVGDDLTRGNRDEAVPQHGGRASLGQVVEDALEGRHDVKLQHLRHLLQPRVLEQVEDFHTHTHTHTHIHTHTNTHTWSK